jgi:hypothetical protein
MSQLGANADRGSDLIVRTKKAGKYVTENLGKTVEPKAGAIGTAKSVLGTIASKTKTMGDTGEK